MDNGLIGSAALLCKELKIIKANSIKRQSIVNCQFFAEQSGRADKSNVNCQLSIVNCQLLIVPAFSFVGDFGDGVGAVYGIFAGFALCDVIL